MVQTEEERKAKRREYESRPEVKAKRKADRDSPEGKKKIKEYNSRPEVVQRKKEYHEKPDQIKKRKEQREKPENKTRKKEYRDSPEGKKKIKEYRERPEIKARNIEYQKTPKAIAQKKEYQSRPEVKARIKKYKSSPKVKAKGREYRQKPENKIKVKEKRNDLRLEVYSLYSKRVSNSNVPCCACCRLKEHIEFLSVDHIYGRKDLPEEEKKLVGYDLNKWLKEHNYPEGFQILCHNCNFTKGHSEDNTCPHERMRKEETFAMMEEQSSFEV